MNYVNSLRRFANGFCEFRPSKSKDVLYINVVNWWEKAHYDKREENMANNLNLYNFY